ncbi:MAG: hypothetical protein ACHQ50_06180 [Fimbriimonadales bacterium]
MDRGKRLLVENWTADYGGGHVESVIVPHAWRQAVPVSFEGPVIYRTEIEVPRTPSSLRFHGVSYQAEVFIAGKLIATHLGIWDSFDVDLTSQRGKRVAVEVRVVKNGGSTFPVRDVASGFLPYVFHTFGGIYGEVELLDSSSAGQPAFGNRLEACATRVDGRKIYVGGKPFYPRGLLHWGWYPELGHTNPPGEAIRSEVRAAKRLGFNLIKFCLWVPSHHYLDILREEEMAAWMELPLWDPTSDPEKLAQIGQEMERIVRQYRHHTNILCWTIGCELSQATPPEYRRRLVQLVKNLTGCPLVKDNSGGAEMYGGDLREFGDFDDFHPYCDLPFYPQVLDSLLPGPRPSRPLLLGEFNDIDVHRDLCRIADEIPFWASGLPELNDKGVRWQLDLPGILPASRFAHEPRKSRHAELMESSRGKALFIRKTVHEIVRAREAISGYVVTGLRDTPISSAGLFDDWGASRFTPEACMPWNGPDVLFQIPTRRPPWLNGGNRPGWIDPFNHFTGQVFFRIGLHSEEGTRGGLIWSILDASGKIVAQDAGDLVDVGCLDSREVGQISWHCDAPGAYRLCVEFGDVVNEWPVNVFADVTDSERDAWKLPVLGTGDATIATATGSVVFRSEGEGTKAMPFWREAAYEFHGTAWGLAERWERLLPISPDLALDPEHWPDHEAIIRRIDVRTYEEHLIAVRTKDKIITTLRPFGGLGIQPIGITRNPSGAQLIREMIASLD